MAEMVGATHYPKGSKKAPRPTEIIQAQDQMVKVKNVDGEVKNLPCPGC